jgi:hypothetical protein
MRNPQQANDADNAGERAGRGDGQREISWLPLYEPVATQLSRAGAARRAMMAPTERRSRQRWPQWQLLAREQIVPVLPGALSDSAVTRA